MAQMIELIKQLREETGAGIADCRMALEEAKGNYAEAFAVVREKAAAEAARRAGRCASQGMIEVYTHGDGRIGVMVEVNAETDFASRSETFRSLAHEIALQIAAAAPLYVRPEDIPAEVIQEETHKATERARAAGKPDGILKRIVAGHLRKYMEKHVLLHQASIRDDKTTVGQLVSQAAASLGENIVIQRFIRWELDGAGSE